MRKSTALYIIALLAVVWGLGVSVRSVSIDKRLTSRREITLALWGAATEKRELEQLVIAPINQANQRFQIRPISIPGDYSTKLATMMAGDVAPDLFYLSQEYVRDFARQGALLDLTELAARDAEPVTNLDLYYPSVLSQYYHDGRLVGLPWIAQPVILYCNVELFRQAGVDLPDGTWDWRRFIDAGTKLTVDLDGDGRTDQWGFIVNGWPPYQMWVWQLGAAVVDPATGRVNLAQPGIIRGLDAYAALIHTHRIAPPLSVVSEMGLSDMFRANKVAMFMGGAADDLDRLPGLEVVAAEVPTGPEGIRATFAWSAGLHISRDVADPDLAFEAFKQVLAGIQHWKIPAPREDLAARLGQIEPRKAASADVIRASMEYMRTPTVLNRQIEYNSLFAEEILDPLLRTGRPAEQLIEQSQPVLGGWQ